MLFVEDDTTPDDARDAQLGSLASKLKEVPRDFPFVTKLFMVLIPVLLAIGYLTYAQVRGGVTISTTPPTTPRLEQGLVGHWTFDGGDMISSTTVRDLSSSNATGTLVNGLTKSIGRFGQGLSFDGSDDYVSLGTGTLGVASGSIGLTLSTWVNVSTFQSYTAFVAKSETGSPYGGWQINTDADAGNRFGGGINISGVWISVRSLRTYSTNRWYHVVMIYDGSNLKLYVDGQLDNTQSAPGTIQYANVGSEVNIGRNPASDVPLRYFAGSLDDVRVYRRPFSEDEIRELYDIGTPTKLNSGISQQQGAGNLDSGLAGYWKLDDGTSGGTPATAIDSSTNGITGTLTNGPIWATGLIGSAVDLDGTNDYINLSTIHNYTSQDFTISYWVKLDSLTTETGGQGPVIIYKGAYQVRGYYSQVSVDGRISFVTNQSGANQSSNTATGTINTGTWYHVSYTRKGANVRIYVNGVDRTATAASHIDPADATSENFLIGTYTVGGNIEMNGKMDEIRVYNRQLSAEEIFALYRTTTPTEVDTSLKGYWSFNGPDMSGTTAYDRSGAGNSGTLTGGPTRTIGKIGQGLLFDGADDHVVINNTATLYQYPDSTFTVSGWFKNTGVATEYLVTQDACNGGWGVYTSSGSLSFRLTASGSCGTNVASKTTSSTTLNDGSWHHMVVVATTSTTNSASNDITIYIDGVLNQGAISRSGSLYGLVSTNLKIGVSDGASGYFNGSLDEIRVYNRALSIDEITNLYHAGRGVMMNAATFIPPI